MRKLLIILLAAFTGLLFGALIALDFIMGNYGQGWALIGALVILSVLIWAWFPHKEDTW